MLDLNSYQGAPVCANENARLAALQRYEILDTQQEEIFDRFSRLAAEFYQTPISLISLVDTDRQWFKAKYGLEATETPRKIAFCAYAILQDTSLLVNDARSDTRFCQNPLVAGPPHIRFYAGAVLTSPEGYNIGTLCIIDDKPRPDVTREKLSALEDLAKMVITELELRRKVAQHEQALHEQKRSNDALQAFSAVAAHDLRAPLRHMVNFSEFLREHIIETTGNPLDSESDRMLGYIHDSGKRLQKMIAKILEFSTIASTASSFCTTSLNQAVAEALQNLAGEIDEKSATITVGELPVVKGEPTLLTLMFQNLIHNALKYSGKEAVAIKISAEKNANAWCIAVEDNGQGVDPAARNTIFQMFSRACDKDEGMGIGLALCHQIASRHAGEIALDQGYAAGARFCITLPAQLSERSAVEPASRLEQAS